MEIIGYQKLLESNCSMSEKDYGHREQPIGFVHDARYQDRAGKDTSRRSTQRIAMRYGLLYPLGGRAPHPVAAFTEVCHDPFAIKVQPAKTILRKRVVLFGCKLPVLHGLFVALGNTKAALVQSAKFELCLRVALDSCLSQPSQIRNLYLTCRNIVPDYQCPPLFSAACNKAKHKDCI